MQQFLADIPFGDVETVLTRVALAAVLSAIIGIDREIKQRTMGLRTNMLVGTGSAVFGLLALEVPNLIETRPELYRIDPTRVIEGIIGGIGFLGAGAIIQRHQEIRGGTTGATIWALGGVGLACGFGLYVHAIVATFVMFLIVTVLGLLTGSGNPGKSEDNAL